MAMKYHQTISALHLQISSRRLLFEKKLANEGLLLSLREDTSDHEHGMKKTTNHLHRQTVNSEKNCLMWRSKLEQQLQLLRQLETQAISRFSVNLYLQN
ncbi:hypothetical protein N665_0531s0011 [Sinapis alba]|nr:hypothetical protein N665_0531s0011 [Sinapis alba]